MSPPFKEYPRFAQTVLPKPRPMETPYSELLAHRRSQRDFDPAGSIPLSALSDMLFCAAGINAQRGSEDILHPRFHPSGGALYPIECYIAAYQVEGIPEATYHYDPRTHCLESLADVSDISKIPGSYKGLLIPEEQNPAAVIILTSVWGRNYPKYGEFAYRLSLMEAGHVMQNILLAATARKVRSYPLAGFRMDVVSSALDITTEDEDPLYMAFLGA